LVYERIVNTERTMSDRYIVKRRDAPPVSCVSERQALQRAAELFDQYGRDVEIEIYLNDVSDSSLLMKFASGVGKRAGRLNGQGTFQ
jgi:hypothetical protein